MGPAVLRPSLALRSPPLRRTPGPGPPHPPVAAGADRTRAGSSLAAGAVRFGLAHPSCTPPVASKLSPFGHEWAIGAAAIGNAVRMASLPRDPVEFVREQGGVTRSARLKAEGLSWRVVADAVGEGRLLRIRRSWLALPDADSTLRAAARAGVVVSCLSAAEHLGLWVAKPRGAHVAASPHAGRVEVLEGTRVHRAHPVVPRHPDALVDALENALVFVAMCVPHEEALVVWESALNKQLVSADAMSRLALPGRARSILGEVQPFADSGLETIVIARLRWMNVRLLAQAHLHGHRVDLLIAERLVLQIDGAHHVGAQRAEDIRHDAVLTLNGFHVIRVGYRQIVDDWPSVQYLVSRAVAQGLHLKRRR